jgi:hypothetical protein
LGKSRNSTQFLKSDEGTTNKKGDVDEVGIVKDRNKPEDNQGKRTETAYNSIKSDSGERDSHASEEHTQKLEIKATTQGKIVNSPVEGVQPMKGQREVDGKETPGTEAHQNATNSQKKV